MKYIFVLFCSRVHDSDPYHNVHIEQLVMTLTAFCKAFLSIIYLGHAQRWWNGSLYGSPQAHWGVSRTWCRERWAFKLLRPIHILECLILSFLLPYEYNGFGTGSSFCKAFWTARDCFWLQVVGHSTHEPWGGRKIYKTTLTWMHPNSESYKQNRLLQ